MFDELTKYKNNDHFFFTVQQALENVCNAPKDKSGIFVVWQLKNGRIELVYIGSSGKIQNNGKMNSKDGLYGSIVNEKQFGEIPRKKSWKQKLIDDEIEALDVYWYDTFNSNNKDIPGFVEATIIQVFFEMHGRLPRWNKEF